MTNYFIYSIYKISSDLHVLLRPLCFAHLWNQTLDIVVQYQIQYSSTLRLCPHAGNFYLATKRNREFFCKKNCELGKNVQWSTQQQYFFNHRCQHVKKSFLHYLKDCFQKLNILFFNKILSGTWVLT